MKTNALPKYDSSNNPTDCCPRFNPAGWDEQELHFDNKPFVHAKTKSIFHIPINMGAIFEKTFKDIEKADAQSDDDFIVLSYDPSSFTGDHYFAVTKDVPGQDMVRLSGDYITRVFEGPYKNISSWEAETADYIRSHGKKAGKIYFFYTTCPRCSKYYGKNYVVAVGEAN